MKVFGKRMHFPYEKFTYFLNKFLLKVFFRVHLSQYSLVQCQHRKHQNNMCNLLGTSKYFLHQLPPFHVKINCSKFMTSKLQRWCHMTLLVSSFVTSRNLLFGVFLPRKVITIFRKITINFSCH